MTEIEKAEAAARRAADIAANQHLPFVRVPEADMSDPVRLRELRQLAADTDRPIENEIDDPHQRKIARWVTDPTVKRINRDDDTEFLDRLAEIASGRVIVGR